MLRGNNSTTAAQQLLIEINCADASTHTKHRKSTRYFAMSFVSHNRGCTSAERCCSPHRAGRRRRNRRCRSLANSSSRRGRSSRCFRNGESGGRAAGGSVSVTDSFIPGSRRHLFSDGSCRFRGHCRHDPTLGSPIDGRRCWKRVAAPADTDRAISLQPGQQRVSALCRRRHQLHDFL